jgi:hypothetical protein
MNSISKIIKDYAAFEADVRAYSTKIYFNHCSDCKGICCKPELCEESLTSPFLSRLRQHFVPDTVYDSRSGWLTETGCALPVGRPPVCYQFLCDTVLNMRPEPDFRYALTILSNLVNHVGKKARGRKHVVELQESSELEHLTSTRFKKQLNEADKAFKLVRSFLDDDAVKLNPSPILKKINHPPSDYIY